jgi:KipI family sensor histidine kinase inhibitor
VSATRTIRRAGDRALLVELAENRQVHQLAAAARQRWGATLEDVVPGSETLLLIWRTGPAPFADVLDELLALELVETTPTAVSSAIKVPVHYDGPDIETVAAAAGVRPEDVPALHSTPVYTAAFIGFAPGFAYLTGGDPRLALPRRETPRVRVEAGSVAVAAGYSAIYPSAGPGGWHIIGRTELQLFDLHAAASPALIEPGTRVIFEPV